METISRIKRKARKDHVCSLCGSKIYKGETYENQINKFDDQMYTWKQCYHCKPILDRIVTEWAPEDGVNDLDFDNFLADHPEIEFKRR